MKSSSVEIVLVLLLLTFALIGDLCVAQDNAQSEEQTLPTTGEVPKRLSKIDQKIISFVKTNRLPGMIVRISIDDQSVYSRGFGYADLEKKKPMTEDLYCRIGSLSKSITCTAILQLVEQGKFKLSDPILKLISGKKKLQLVDERMNDITVLQCMNHTSGMHHEPGTDYVCHPRYLARSLGVKHKLKPRELYKAVLAQKLTHDPGTHSEYNNTGYFLLGLLIEKVSKKSYERYLQKNVFEPLGIKGMEIAGSLKHEIRKDEVQYHYIANPIRLPAATGRKLDQVVEAQFAWDFKLAEAAGGWLARTSDVMTFANSFRDPEKRLISDESIRVMLGQPEHLREEFAKTKGSIKYLTCGWRVRDYLRATNLPNINYFHDGVIDSANCYVASLYNGVTIVVFCNTRENEPATALGDKLVSDLLALKK